MLSTDFSQNISLFSIQRFSLLFWQTMFTHDNDDEHDDDDDGDCDFEWMIHICECLMLSYEMYSHYVLYCP